MFYVCCFNLTLGMRIYNDNYTEQENEKSGIDLQTPTLGLPPRVAMFASIAIL